MTVGGVFAPSEPNRTAHGDDIAPISYPRGNALKALAHFGQEPFVPPLLLNFRS
ncbi:hypothetical protein ABIB28_003153 [Sphingomonas sp. UYEF23]